LIDDLPTYEFDGDFWRVYFPNGRMIVARTFREASKLAGVVWH